MRQFRFNDNVNQAIVDGILQGYKNYLNERKEKRENMRISTAYAWVRGNHIDDQTAASCEDIGIDYLTAKAGVSWGYLQFTNDEERNMFIVKNGYYLDKQNITKRKNITGSDNSKAEKTHYLYKLAQINKNVDLKRNIQLELSLDDRAVIFDDEPALLDIVDDELDKLQNKYDYFYIISYETDHYQMMSKIELLLPTSNDGQAHKVDDLTKYIETSTVDMSGIDLSIVADDLEDMPSDYPDAAWFNITTYDDSDEEKSDK